MSNDEMFNPATTNKRVLLVGHGRWGALYAQALAARSALAGVVVATESSARRAAHRWSVPTWTDLEKAVLESRADGLAVLSPSSLHAAHIAAGIDAGLPTMVIRPATIDPDVADKLHDRATDAGVPVLAGHEMAWVPPIPRIAWHITKGAIGRLQKVTLIAEGSDYGGPAGDRPMPEEAGRNLAYVYETVMHDLVAAHALHNRSPVVTVAIADVFASFAQPRLDATVTHENGAQTRIVWDGNPDLPFRRATVASGTDGELAFEAGRGHNEFTLKSGKPEQRHGDVKRLALHSEGPTDDEGPGDQAGAVIHQLLAVLDGARPDHDLHDAAIIQRGTRAVIAAVAAHLGIEQPDLAIYGPADQAPP